MAKVFNSTGHLSPRKSMYNLSHSVLTTLDFGKLYPIDFIECIPGDFFDLKVQIVARLTAALESPILSQFDLVVEAFFEPVRILSGSDAPFDCPPTEETFENFIRGGKDGKQELSLPLLSTMNKNTDTLEGAQPILDSVACGGIADYLGLQLGIHSTRTGIDPSFSYVQSSILAYAHRMYRHIWNEFYRYEFLQEELQVPQSLTDSAIQSDSTFIDWSDYDALLYRGWKRDYFTSALPFQQFGTSPAFQLEGNLPLEFTPLDTALSSKEKQAGPMPEGSFFGEWLSNAPNGFYFTTSDKAYPSGIALADGFDSGSASHFVQAYINLQNAVTFDISDIRTNFQIQKWMERNARGGVRYTEYLLSHFGVAPSDMILQRPYFIGAGRSPWYVSEVLQTSSSVDGSSQGNQAGQATCIGQANLGKFRCKEFGYIMIIASVVPKAMYQQGIDRKWTRYTNLDWYSPEFQHLSEQAVLSREIMVDPSEESTRVSDESYFGFQPIWNELRYLNSRVTGHMRTDAPDYSFDYWHFARYFSEVPLLNSEFLQIGSTEYAIKELHRIFSVQDEDPFVVHFGVNIKASRPLDKNSEPGLVDHF